MLPWLRKGSFPDRKRDDWPGSKWLSVRVDRRLLWVTFLIELEVISLTRRQWESETPFLSRVHVGNITDPYNGKQHFKW